MANLQQQSPLTGGMSYDGIQNYWDALMEDKENIAFLPYGDEYWDAMNLIMNSITTRQIAKQPQVSWFEWTRQEVPFTVSNGPVAITSGQYTVTLPSSEIDPSTGYSWPIKHEIWRYAPSGNLYQIVDKPDSATLVLRPLNATTENLADNAQFFYVGVSVPEGSDPQQPKFAFDTQYTTYLQSMRNDYKTTSEAMYNQLWYDQLENGKRVPFSQSKDIMYLQREHTVSIVNTFLAGDSSTNLANTTSFQTTPGLIPTIFSRGQTQDTGGDIDATDFYALEAKLTQQDGSVKNYMIWTTDTTSADIEQNMLTYNQNANIQVNKLAMNKTFWGEGALADQLSTTYSFNNLVFNNKNFGLVRFGVFDNPQIFAATGSIWNQYAVVIPMTQGGVDNGLGAMGKYIRLCHKPDAFMNMWDTGGRSRVNRTGKWEFNIHCVSEIAFMFINANKYGIFYDAV